MIFSSLQFCSCLASFRSIGITSNTILVSANMALASNPCYRMLVVFLLLGFPKKRKIYSFMFNMLMFVFKKSKINNEIRSI